MQKKIPTILMATLCLIFNLKAQQPGSNKPPQNTVIGKVISATDGIPLSGAVIKNTIASQTVISNDNGEFTISLADGSHTLSVFHLSYKEKTLTIQIPLKEKLLIELETNEQNLKEVEIVSTGYQNIPKERATGSFTLIDNKLLNRTVSPDILTRLQGVTNGLLFDRQTGNPMGISVRGRSTIFSNTQPLIVVDNFPFEGDINTINPNDVENVSILKDAAAASIWGTRAGNGVIVITTKRGGFNQVPSITFNGNVAVAQKPDLYYEEQLSSSDFIDLERFLFDKGKYTSTINNGYATISPVIAILQRQKLGELLADQANAEIDKYRNLDVRNQLNEYLYRQNIRQQYHFNVAGGGVKQSYFFSGGYDGNQASDVGKSNGRFTLKGNNTYKLLNDKLAISTDLSFSTTKNKNSNLGYNPYLPYDQIADANGKALPVLRSDGLRESFTDVVGNGSLLDWKYRPLDEVRNKYSTLNSNLTDYRLNLGLNYKIISPLSISANYQYYKASTERENHASVESFTTRNSINTATYIDDVTGELIRPIPLGGIYRPGFNSTLSNSGRIQLNFNETFAEKHQINAIAGYESREDNGTRNSSVLYGYNPEIATSINVNQTKSFQSYFVPGKSTSISSGSQGWDLDRYTSYYVNTSYAYNNKYIVSGSFRKDMSNLFGVKANQKGVPLWSGGLAWNLHNEQFYTLRWLSSLKLRTTYGFNGNVNKNVSAYLTAEPNPSGNNDYSVNFASIVNPPNDALRWERVENINFGIDFSTRRNRISGSIEYYIKNGIDLIGTSPIAPQAGIISFTGNAADTHSKGVDIQINSINFDQAFKWQTTVIFNYVKDRITDYKANIGSNSTIVFPGAARISPIKDYPINALFAYKWAGLDENGNPRGKVKGAVSNDYTAIRNSNDYTEMDFWGSAMPTTFGGFRNTFSYKVIELSFNLSYKFGYYVRRSSLNYLSLFGGGFGNPDYLNRWQKPGDELITDVPSMVYPNNTGRNDFYTYSSALMEKGDHIRLQDIQLNFNLTKKQIRNLPLPNLNIYAYATNLGLLWKASDNLRDPDVRTGYPSPFSLAFGIITNF